MKSKKLSILCVLFLVLVSCSKDRFKIDTDEIKMNLTIERFDRDLMSLDTANFQQSISKLETKYPGFFSYYFNQVFRIGSPDSAIFFINLNGLLRDSMYQEVYKECQLVYKDVSDIENEISEAFKYIKYYFPEKKIPRFAMHISGFNQSIITTPEFISVSIDNYLGADYAPYKSLAYDYQLQKMSRKMVAPDILLAYLRTEFPFENNSQLLANLLWQGKVRYLQSIFMPQHSEADLMGYTSEQIDWCIKNEKNMWTYIVEHKHLYNTSQIISAKYLNPAPFTTYFTEESPGEAGIWLGLQIVKSYMQNNSDITLTELIKQTDYQLMLENSNYKP